MPLQSGLHIPVTLVDPQSPYLRKAAPCYHVLVGGDGRLHLDMFLYLKYVYSNLAL